MRKFISSQSGICNARVVIAIVLCSIGASFGWLSFAATPPSGTLSPATPVLNYEAGPLVPNQSPLGLGQLDTGPRCNDTTFPCDSYALTVSLPPGYHDANPNAAAKVTLSWDNASPSTQGASDYDLYIYRGVVTTLSGNRPAEYFSAGDSTVNPEVASIIPLADGDNAFTIKVVAYQPAGETIHVRIELLSGSGGSGFPGFGQADPTIPGVPRYQTFATNNNSGSGEYNIGYNPATGRIMNMNSGPVWRITPAEKLTPAKPECCPELWENKSNPTTNIGVDPILWTDQWTDANPLPGQPSQGARTFASNSTAGTNGVYGFTDDDGETWLPLSASPPNASSDHQTIGSGPYPAAFSALGNAVNHGHAVYYCAQTFPIGGAGCQRSDSYGANYGPSTFPYTGNLGEVCSGIHGHLKVGPDGTVYLPVRNCSGNSGLAVSLDAGTTWTTHAVPNSKPGGSDPSIAIGAKNTIYYFYTKQNTDNTEIHAHGVVGTMTVAGTPAVPTIAWSNDTDLGATHGVVHSAFPEAVAGDDDRASVGFLGTDRAGSSEALDFPGYWYLFIATTYDGGNSWDVVNASPNEPVQGKGGIWLGGGSNTNRNLLDFNEVTMTDKGYVLFGYSDGCVGGCVGNPESNSFTAHMRVARQIGGKPLLSQFDPNPAEPALPKAPCLSGTRNASGVHLTWKAPDNAGADILSYSIFRGTASGDEIFLINTGDNKTTFDDITANPAQPAFYYIRAVNSVDAAGGTVSNEVNFAATPGIQLLGITSTKTHGATPFAVNLPLDGSAIEPRSGGAKGNFTMIFDFADSVSSVTSAAVVAGTGSVSSAAIQDGNYVVNLTGVSNAQRLTVRLTEVTDSTGNTVATLNTTMGLLLGDTTGNGSVNSSDIGQTKSQSGQAVTISNFRTDVSVNDAINSTDISLVKSQSGTALP